MTADTPAPRKRRRRCAGYIPNPRWEAADWRDPARRRLSRMLRCPEAAAPGSGYCPDHLAQQELRVHLLRPGRVARDRDPRDGGVIPAGSLSPFACGTEESWVVTEWANAHNEGTTDPELVTCMRCRPIADALLRDRGIRDAVCPVCFLAHPNGACDR